MFLEIIYGIFFIFLGSLVLKYRKIIKGWTGNFVWAEHYLGRGGTYFIIILFGLGLMFYGVTYPFGGISSVIDSDAQKERETIRERQEMKETMTQ